ncbi:hypothetical protein [Anaeromyxobacter sp. K]|uniref:hypothetical protein n=1 Tax=Anaeromyxobacter sp. (strain K) TaxID=447217 RepID=UPI00059D1BB7|nr:hypothetical protein [Anaeromyxobacter sp. K]
MDWVTAYDFAEDPDQIRAMQQATLSPTDAGVSASPALVGSPEWWRAIDSGNLPLRILEGAITRVYWASMGDWPELELTSDAGEKSTWTPSPDRTDHRSAGLHRAREPLGPVRRARRGRQGRDRDLRRTTLWLFVPPGILSLVGLPLLRPSARDWYEGSASPRETA